MESYDDPNSFRGQLQRGRGIAARRAPNLAQAGDAVYECVLDDPRWDRQTDTRDTYLAGLVQELDLPLAPTEDRLTAFDEDDVDDISLLLDVLAVLAVTGHEDAVGVLHRYVTSGKHWSAALNAVTFAEPVRAPGVSDALVDAAVACRTDAELREVIENGDDSWMRASSQGRPRLQRLFAPGHGLTEQQRATVATARQWMRTIAEQPRSELLQQVAQGTSRRRMALQELGRRGDRIVLDLVEDPALRNAGAWIPGAAQALEHLGATAVPRARVWISGDATMADLGMRVLAASGDRDDAPSLISTLQRAFEDDGLWCTAEIPAEGLGRLQVPEAAPLLSATWERTVHSRARATFLTALLSCAPQAAEVFADEGLDDCEPTVREIARAATS